MTKFAVWTWTLPRGGISLVSDKSRSWSVWGLNMDVFADGLRTRIVCGHGQAADTVVDWTRPRPVGRPLQDLFQPLQKHCAGNCVDDSSEVGRMLRGHCAGTDWPRTGHGLDAAADIVPAIRQHWLGRYPSIARMRAE